jgi:hypothetical protein
MRSSTPSHQAWALLLVMLLLAWGTGRAAGREAASDSAQCSAALDAYIAAHPREAAPFTGGDQMVYFLHVPRTAGRTFHSCFLKAGTSPERRCPKAYDHLRINTSVPNCYMLSSHDDFSVVSMLPPGAAVLTHLRDPLDRFLSAYEFAIEVATRLVNRPANFKKRADRMATEEVWPWSYLVPWFAADIKQRVRHSMHTSQHCSANVQLRP